MQIIAKLKDLTWFGLYYHFFSSEVDSWFAWVLLHILQSKQACPEDVSSSMLYVYV
jgi:hypothetical protein